MQDIRLPFKHLPSMHILDIHLLRLHLLCKRLHYVHGGGV